MSFLNKLAFPVTPAILAQYNTPQNFGLFDADRLIVEVAPDGYTPIWNDIGEAEIEYGFASTTVQISAKQYGFEIQAGESRPDLYYCLRQLAKNAAAVRGRYRAIVVHDYIVVEPEDAAIGYTVRLMKMVNLSLASGSIAIDGKRYHTGGLTFRMLEIEPREAW